MQEEEKASKRDQVFDLEKYVGKKVRICFFGGIEVTGCLLGYDQLLNIVLGDGKMASFSEQEDKSLDLGELMQEAPSSMMCKGVSICSIDLMTAPESAEEYAYPENAYYTIGSRG
ncbi:U6 snRNA-associated Sm-like protein LSm7 [Nematocida ausubeli]|uniref:Sm domain-containing protein n=1 Tax=Nematocida ausubeli (strain ATCC PRA-371 / ERTm2) TaxID=1913371 RepID=H8ZEQ5_NEMA1|nr:hypothetical protein NERG_02076 [Nematocida ausubeli]KAI5162319.1 U6 snRNA-associated Sm-like protein LSm7 [Nematocida ausubeli]